MNAEECVVGVGLGSGMEEGYRGGVGVGLHGGSGGRAAGAE